jgi:hypothetical protein
LKGKHLEQSHLTPEERGEAIKYSTVATVLIAVGITFGIFGWVSFSLAEVLVSGGLIIMAFIWGYLGALEDERSGKE